MINATREIRTAHATYCDELCRCVQFAALADRVAQLPPSTPLPEYRHALSFGYSPERERAMRAGFSEAAVRLAVLGMLGATDAHVRGLVVLRRCAEEAAAVDPELSLEDCRRDMLSAARAACRGRTAVDLLDLAVVRRSAELGEAVRWLEGLCALRQCLERPGGVVSDEDVPPGAEKLKVVWRKTVGALDGDQAESLRHALLGEHMMTLRYVEQSRAFARGAPVVLDPADADAIAISLACLSGAMCRQLHAEIAALVG